MLDLNATGRRKAFTLDGRGTDMEATASDWRVIPEEPWDGPMNMALDEVAAETVANGGPRTVRVYRWRPSTLSLGYNQDPDTIDWAFCEREGITVTRRPTGGGAIYHDAFGDISYSIIAPKASLPGDLIESYRELCTPVLEAFDAMGVHADFADEPRPELLHPVCYLRELHPAHDIVAGGRKISGNAQYRQRDAVIQHGSLSYARDAVRHLGCFTSDAVSPGTFRDRVTSIREESGIERGTAVAALERGLTTWSGGVEGFWSDGELERARDLVTEKFGTDRWTRRGRGER